jgi:hypothetical protein
MVYPLVLVETGRLPPKNERINTKYTKKGTKTTNIDEEEQRTNSN